MEESIIFLPLAGLIMGCVLGFVARKNFFCTMSSLEQYWYGNNSAGVRTWALAALVAMTLSQLLARFGFINPTASFYLNPSFGWFGTIIGGLMFGFGMALVGTCGFGALVRLGGGSLKSLMAVLVLGLVAMSTQKGALVYISQPVTGFGRAELPSSDQSIPTMVSEFAGQIVGTLSIFLVLFLLAWWVFANGSFRSDRASILTGATIGCIISAGWLITNYTADVSFDPIQVESASFVAPISDAILQVSLLTGTAPDYGVGMVIGVVVGAAIAAVRSDDLRWEACDDARELSRHIMGAALMGFGGILAAGCTIGQGVSAASLMAVSTPIALMSIVIGARMGLSYLLEGNVFAGFRD